MFDRQYLIQIYCMIFHVFMRFTPTCLSLLPSLVRGLTSRKDKPVIYV
uniref:Splicing factor 3b subunit n=1 Tax=Triatoma infestans TaxID=30076 RepID=A0A170UYM0_TRIIF